MKKLIVAVALLFISLSSAFAQPDAKYTSTLKTMLELAGTEATFQAAIKQMCEMMKQQMKSVPASVWEDVEKEFAGASMGDLVKVLAPVYFKHLTQADLEQLIEFYQSPIGKKYAQKTPLLTQESMQVGQQWGMKIGQKLRDRLKEKGY